MPDTKLENLFCTRSLSRDCMWGKNKLKIILHIKRCVKTTSEKQNAPVVREGDFVPIFLIASSLSHSLVSVSLF